MNVLAWFRSLFNKPVVSPTPPSQPVQPPYVPQIIIVRTYGQKETTGTLNLIKPDGTFWTCKTLELPWLNNDPNVSCIPVGTYPASLQPFHNVMRYELAGVLGRFAIFMHEGNFATGNEIDTAGCILLGSELKDINGDGQLDVIDSVATVSMFIMLLANYPSITVQIK